MDTIFALSTAQGKAGVAVIRISGPDSHDAIARLCGDVPPPRIASLRRLHAADGTSLDDALILVFAGGQSFTGEASVEIHCHGSIATVSAILDELGRNETLRAADPGEFTRRALENGKLDLAQVEGLADLIEAETEAQRQQALRVLSGDLGRRAEAWRQNLIRAAALLEATIDFADEDVPVDVSPEVRDLITSVLDMLKRDIAGVNTAERIRSGFEVAIVGAPNVGKSTLLNALAGRDAAITSEYAGTTRDVIEVRMDLGGLPVTLLDTAGLRETEDVVESIGIGRARERAEQADLRVFLVENGASPDLAPREEDLVLQAKSDLHGGGANGISGKTGAGVEALVQSVTERLRVKAGNAGVATRLRHKQAMERGVVALERALELIAADAEMTDVAAEEIRIAIRGLDSLVGRVDVENILDEIFASFCLGK